MSLLESIFIPLGTKMSDFTLKDAYGNEYKGSEQYGDRGLLIAFTCNHCPYAMAVWQRFIDLANHANNLRINTLAINPNIHPDYPQDSPEEMKKKIEQWGLPFPYLIDETQEVARKFKAQCTPDIYLFDKDHKLIYHGRIDDNWEDESKVTKEELRDTLNNHAAGLPITNDQKPSMGCSIKWRS